MLKILDNVPVWKTLVTLPRRVEALEQRLAALEAKPAAPGWMTCKLCGGAMDVTVERPDPVFGAMGKKRLDLRCGACGRVTDHKT
jgi:hypothetical protein